MMVQRFKCRINVKTMTFLKVFCVELLIADPGCDLQILFTNYHYSGTGVVQLLLVTYIDTAQSAFDFPYFAFSFCVVVITFTPWNPNYLL